MTAPVVPAPAVPLCSSGHGAMRQRTGKTGAFWGCTKYPGCRNTAPVGLLGVLCPQCNSPIAERVAKKSGRPFWPCSSRQCEFVAWEKPHHCRGCGELLRAIKEHPGGRKPVGAPPHVSRSQAARDAGLSKDQKVSALRVARIPAEERSRLAPDAVPDPAIPPAEDEEVPF